MSADTNDRLLAVARIWCAIAVPLLAFYWWRQFSVGWTDGAGHPFGEDFINFWSGARLAIGGEWRVWDATRLAPRSSLIRVSTGRDAADTAFATVLSGHADLDRMEIMAVVLDGDLPADDHRFPVHLL